MKLCAWYRRPESDVAVIQHTEPRSVCGVRNDECLSRSGSATCYRQLAPWSRRPDADVAGSIFDSQTLYIVSSNEVEITIHSNFLIAIIGILESAIRYEGSSASKHIAINGELNAACR